MIKCVLVIFAFVVLVEGLPAFPADFIEAARKENWEQFQKLLLGLTLTSFGDNWPSDLAGSVESLRPSEGTHVYGHSLTAFKEWSNENGNISEHGTGLEVENNDGVVSKRTFRP